MSLKFSSRYHFSGQITSKVLLQDDPCLGIGGQVTLQRLNLPSHAPNRLYYHGIHIGCDATHKKR